MQGYLMHALRTSCQITHAALPMLAFMFVKFVLWDLGCGLKAENGNIMDVLDVLEEKKNFFFCSQRYESFPSPKTAYSYLLK